MYKNIFNGEFIIKLNAYIYVDCKYVLYRYISASTLKNMTIDLLKLEYW